MLLYFTAFAYNLALQLVFALPLFIAFTSATGHCCIVASVSLTCVLDILCILSSVFLIELFSVSLSMPVLQHLWVSLLLL